MAAKFQNRYRIESARLQRWDYRWNASYFVTICTKNRICFFGDVVDGVMAMNDIGHIANDCWLQIPEHFPFVKLGKHIVMPNHMHGIVIIDKPDGGRGSVERNVDPPNLGGSTHQTRAATQRWTPGSLGVIINQYKRAVTIGARKFNADFTWQSRFHDHIIRDDDSFQRISEYIINNPRNWSRDTFF